MVADVMKECKFTENEKITNRSVVLYLFFIRLFTELIEK